MQIYRLKMLLKPRSLNWRSQHKKKNEKWNLNNRKLTKIFKAGVAKKWWIILLRQWRRAEKEDNYRIIQSEKIVLVGCL